jgi:hypothetical protein
LVAPPFAANISDYLDQSVLKLTNSSNVPLSIMLKGTLTSDNGINGRTKDTYKPLRPIVVPPNNVPLIIQATKQNRVDFFDSKNVDYNTGPYNLADIVRTGVIPEGNYTLCIAAYDYTTGEVKSKESGFAACRAFNIIIPQPPTVDCEANAPTLNGIRSLAVGADPAIAPPLDGAPTFIRFNWLPTNANGRALIVAYDLYLLKLDAGQNGADALLAAIRLKQNNAIKFENIRTPQYDALLATTPSLVSGKYAWAVVAKDGGGGQTPFQNNGISQVCEFEYKAFDFKQILAINTGATQQVSINLGYSMWTQFRVKDYKVMSGKIVEEFIGNNLRIFRTDNPNEGLYDKWGVKTPPQHVIIRIKKTSNLEGIEAKILFEAKFNDKWQDAFEIHVDVPFLGKNKFNVRCFDGYEIACHNNGETSGSLQSGGISIFENGFWLRTHDVYRYKVIDANVNVIEKNWLQKSKELPQTGDMAFQGQIKVDKTKMKPKQGYSFKEALEKSLRIKCNYFEKAVWEKKSNAESFIVLTNPTTVGKSYIYNINEEKGTAYYRIINLPLIANGKVYPLYTPELYRRILKDPKKPLNDFAHHLELLEDTECQTGEKSQYRHDKPLGINLGYELTDASTYWESLNGPMNNNPVVNGQIVSGSYFRVDAEMLGNGYITSTNENTIYDINKLDPNFEFLTTTPDIVLSGEEVNRTKVLAPIIKNPVKATIDPKVNPAKKQIRN